MKHRSFEWSELVAPGRISTGAANDRKATTGRTRLRRFDTTIDMTVHSSYTIKLRQRIRGIDSGRRRALSLALLLSLSAITAASCRQSGDLRLLTDIRQVRELSAEEARLGYPVRVRGKIISLEQASNILILHDGDMGVPVDLSGAQATVEIGQQVEVTGFTRDGDDTAMIIRPVLTVSGKGEMPKPRAVSIRELAAGSAAYEWVEVHGVVRSAKISNDGQLLLDLGSESSIVHLRVNRFAGNDHNSLIDAGVRVHGVARTLFDSQQHPMRLTVLVPDIQNIIVEQPAPGDAFNLPLHSISQVQSSPQTRESEHRVRIQGTAIEQRPDGTVRVTDETGTLDVQTMRRTQIKTGGRVEAVGFSSLSGSEVALEHSLMRETDSKDAGSNISNAPLTVMGSVAQIHGLKSDEAARRHPISLRAVVTYYEPVWHFAFVEDRTGGIFIDSSFRADFPVRPGQLVNVEGQTASGDFAPIISRAVLRLVGESPLPIARRLPFDE